MPNTLCQVLRNHADLLMFSTVKYHWAEVRKCMFMGDLVFLLNPLLLSFSDNVSLNSDNVTCIAQNVTGVAS